MESMTFQGVVCAHCGAKQDIVLQVESLRTEDQGGGHKKNIYYLKRENHICIGCGAAINWISGRTSLNCIRKEP